MLCLDLTTGKENWRSAYPAPYRLGGPAHGFEGPRSTPAVADGRVFTFGISGIVSCLNAKTGKVIWRREFAKEYPEKAPVWGTASSPVVEGDLCILHVGGWSKGGLTAFDARTGETKWCYEGEGSAYGSPIVVDLAGERQVVTLTLHKFLGVSARTGKLLWEVPCEEIHAENCLTPVLYKDLLLIAGRKEGPWAIRLEKKDSGITPKEVWRTKRPTLYMSSPVLAGDWLVGFSDQKLGHLFCLDAGTGKTLWQSEGRLGASASILNAGDVWLVLTTGGQLLVAKPSPTAYQLIAQYRVSDSRTYAHPVFLGNRMLVRDEATLRSFRCDRKEDK